MYPGIGCFYDMTRQNHHHQISFRHPLIVVAVPVIFYWPFFSLFFFSFWGGVGLILPSSRIVMYSIYNKHIEYMASSQWIAHNKGEQFFLKLLICFFFFACIYQGVEARSSQQGRQVEVVGQRWQQRHRHRRHLGFAILVSTFVFDIQYIHQQQYLAFSLSLYCYNTVTLISST